MMDIGFNIIETGNSDIFEEKLSIIEFLRKLREEERLPYNFAVTGLDTLLYYAEDREETEKYIRTVLEDAANFLVAGNYIIQVIVEGDLYVVESYERPGVRYKGEEILLYPVFGRVKQLDIKHFLAPLNLLS